MMKLWIKAMSFFFDKYEYENKVSVCTFFWNSIATFLLGILMSLVAVAFIFMVVAPLMSIYWSIFPFEFESKILDFSIETGFLLLFVYLIFSSIIVLGGFWEIFVTSVKELSHKLEQTQEDAKQENILWQGLKAVHNKTCVAIDIRQYRD